MAPRDARFAPFMCVSGEHGEPQEHGTPTGMPKPPSPVFPSPQKRKENAEKELRCQISSAALKARCLGIWWSQMNLCFKSTGGEHTF